MGTKDLTHEAIAEALSSGQPLTQEQRGVLLGLVANDQIWQREVNRLMAELQREHADHQQTLRDVDALVAAERERCKRAVYDATDWAHEERDFTLKEAIVEWIENGPNVRAKPPKVGA